MKRLIKPNRKNGFYITLLSILITQVFISLFLYGYANAKSRLEIIRPREILPNNLSSSQYLDNHDMQSGGTVIQKLIKPTATPVELARPLNVKIKNSILGLGTLSIIIVLVGLWLNYKKINK